jgi:hypothetical protein
MEEKKLIFICPEFSCKICGSKNYYVVVINEHGQASYGGSVCFHVKDSLVGKEIDPRDARNFLELEKKEAKEVREKATGEKHEHLVEFIKKTNEALERLKKPCAQQRKVA